MGTKEVDAAFIEAEDFLSDDSSFQGDDNVKAEFEHRLQSSDLVKYWQAQKRDINVQAWQGRRAAQEDGEKKAATASKVNSDGPSPVQTVAVAESPSKLKKEWSAIFRPKGVHDVTPMKLDSKATRSPDKQATPSAEQKATELPEQLYNPYEGDEMAKQLAEPLSDFLARLPPATTPLSSGPWIWIANPHASPRLTHRDIAGFKDEGTELLTEYMFRKRQLEERNPGEPAGTLTRLLKSDRDWLEAAIATTAVKKGITNGKWMLFPSAKHVDKLWSTVATATWDGRLGCAAKVATTDPSHRDDARLICIYTQDFTDKQDVQRVLGEMATLGLVKRGSEEERAIFYKCDAYTYLDIMSGNEYKLRASMYSSRDMWKEMDMR